MRKLTLVMALGGLLVLAAACASGDGDSRTGTAAADITADTNEGVASQGADAPRPVDLAIEIFRKLEADPDHALEILDGYGLTDEDYEDLLYEIAADPELRMIYNEATAPPGAD